MLFRSPGGYHYHTFGDNFIDGVKYLGQENALELTLNTSNTSRFSTFRVNFVKGIDLTKYDGIRIKYKLTEVPYYADDIALWFMLVGDSTNWNESGGNNDAPHDVVTLNEWGVLTLTNEQLDKFLNDGDEYITLCVYRRTGGVSANGTVKLLLGEISYYSQLEAPANVSLSDNVFSW